MGSGVCCHRHTPSLFTADAVEADVSYWHAGVYESARMAFRNRQYHTLFSWTALQDSGFHIWYRISSTSFPLLCGIMTISMYYLLVDGLITVEELSWVDNAPLYLPLFRPHAVLPWGMPCSPIYVTNVEG